MTAAAQDVRQRLAEAMQWHQQGKLDAAASAYETLLKEHPHQPALLQALGVIHMQKQQWEKATECLVGLLMVQPAHAEAAQWLYQALLAQAANTQLEQHPVQALIKAYPALVPLRSAAASLCQALGKHSERLSHLEAVRKLGIESEALAIEYIKALRDNGQYARALEVCQQGLRGYSHSLPLLKLRAELYLTLGEYTEALADGEEIVKRIPDDHYARTTLGSIKLLISDCREGYEDYAAHGDFAIAANKLDICIPAWRGGPLAGKKLLLWSSQGIGDIIMFASLLPWVLAQGGEVILATYNKLIPLFARSFPGLQMIEHTPEQVAKTAQQCDVHAVLGQLMQFGLPHYMPSQHSAYLKADARAATLRKTYQAQANGRKLIGISWSTTNAQTFSQRNIPLMQWKPLFDLSHIQCVSLQYGDHGQEIEELNDHLPGALLHDPSIDAYNDTEALAAQIAAMDEVVSIQNSTVHLAGALGIKTTLLLCAASDWRWGLKRTDSHWYQSVTIERQETLLDWQPMLERIAGRL